MTTPSLLDRVREAGFTVSCSGIPSVLRVEPAHALTTRQRTTLAAHADEVLCDVLWPPLSAADEAHIAAVLAAWPTAGTGELTSHYRFEEDA